MNNDARNDICNLFNINRIMDQTINLKRFDIPKLLYKYTSINEYLINNLKNNQLTATVPTEFNDLYDSTMHFNTLAQYEKSNREINEGFIKLGMHDAVNPKLSDDLVQQALELDEFSLTYLSEDFRISCLSSSYQDIKMWSHYSDNNKGICIAYDFSKCTNEIDKFIYPVLYVDKPMDVTELCEEKNQIMLAALISTISKFRDWEHENEWRIIFWLMNHPAKRIPLIGIPKPELIYLGNRFIPNAKYLRKYKPSEFNLIQEFIEFAKNSSITIKTIKRQIRSYQLEYEETDADFILREIKSP